MRTREKQNKHKLKFQYIAHLKMLGKIWKEHCTLVKSKISIADVNYNNEDVSGYAFGVGIERIAMLKYRINDIRSFYNSDIRFIKQFQ